MFLRRAFLALFVVVCGLAVPAFASADVTVQGEAMSQAPSTTGVVYSDANAVGDQAFLMYHNGTISGTVTTTAPTTDVRVLMRGKKCVNGTDSGWPHVDIRVDGVMTWSDAEISALAYTNYQNAVSLPAGSHTVTVAFTNDYSNSTCDRNVVVDQALFVAGSTPYLFEDDFNGTAGSTPSSTRWTDYGPSCGAYAGWGKIACGSNETVDGSGHLQLPATASTGSALQTKGKFSCLYCRFNVWAKMPSQAGYWPGIWTLNGSQTGSEVLTAETDITEVYTTWSGSNSTLHAWNGGADVWDASNTLAGTSLDLSAAYHEYSVRFASGVVTFYLDNTVVATISKASSPWYWGPDITRGHFLILDLAVGGAGQAVPSANGTMLVDRVEAVS